MTGKPQPYPEYQETGIEWLGRVPIGWSIHALKRAVDGCVNGIWGSEPGGDNDLTVLRVADFNRVKLEVSDKKLTTRSIPERDRKARQLKKGDLLIEKSGGGEKTLVGCVVKFDKDYPAVTSNFVAKMTPKEGFDSGFLNYAFAHLYSGRVNFPAIKQTTGIQNLDSGAYLMERFVFPTENEQRTIATFLNYETARIDTLIVKQQRLIELLKEKRQAVISNAVTKGLNPDVPRKDSGVEWLSEVPEHWIVTRLKLCTRKITDGEHISPSFVEEGVPFLSAKDIRDRTINYEVDKFVSVDDARKFRKRCDPVKGDILVVSRGATIGRVGLVENTEVFCLLGSVILLKPTVAKVSPLYLFYLLNQEAATEQFLLASQASAQQAIYLVDLAELLIVLPPLDEQEVIVHELEVKICKLDSVIKRSKEATALLAERRTALISGAVTGKIDLRGWQPPVQESRDE